MSLVLIDYPFLICVIVMITSEITKHLFTGFTSNIWFAHGGMPSSHSAFVTSLLMVIGTMTGLGSSEFAIASVFAGIVWYDAAFVRKQVGNQAKALNVLQQFQQFSERVGHSLSEVFGGIVFGALMTWWILTELGEWNGWMGMM